MNILSFKNIPRYDNPNLSPFLPRAGRSQMSGQAREGSMRMHFPGFHPCHSCGWVFDPGKCIWVPPQSVSLGVTEGICSYFSFLLAAYWALIFIIFQLVNCIIGKKNNYYLLSNTLSPIFFSFLTAVGSKIPEEYLITVEVALFYFLL